MTKFLLYFHTLKYLKLTQIYHRIIKRFNHPKVVNITGIVELSNGSWVVHELYQQKFIDKTKLNFLNHAGTVEVSADWNNDEQEKLWLYNLHYFDDLNSHDSNIRRELQLYWINKWIDQNPGEKRGNGWEPYTLSLRIVNWSKGFLSGLEYDQKIINSLAQQADFLSQDLEKHLLGNHYFVNLKALLFAGCFLQGKEAEQWVKLGLKDFEFEVREQVLSDGGSFELTPMYHAIMLTDLLDLYNLFNVFPQKIPKLTLELVHKTIVKMLAWLDIMSHQDDKVSFFNDSSFGIAPENNVIRDYAEKLGFNIANEKIPENTLVAHDLQNTGYVVIKSNQFNLIADLSPVGPSYIPGHAHADTLSFEFSLGDSRVFVNSGISEYGLSHERTRQRGTSAHNTVLLNHRNSSEVWSGFRVARRAEIANRRVERVSSDQEIEFSAEHNGYEKQGIKCIHYRSWKVSLSSCVIKDFLQGEHQSAIGFLHLHPSVDIVSIEHNTCLLRTGSYEVLVEMKGADITIENSTWHPEFGIVISSNRIKLRYLLSKVEYKINWQKI